MYAFWEFLHKLLFSHEVVHGKKSLMHKMWGDRYNQFRRLEKFLTYQIVTREEIARHGFRVSTLLEWRSEEQLEWSNSLEDDMNRKMGNSASPARPAILPVVMEVLLD